MPTLLKDESNIRVVTLGSELRRLREERRWSLSAAASRLEISKQYLSMLESDQRTPSLEVAFAITEEYEIPIQYIKALLEKENIQENATSSQLKEWKDIDNQIKDQIFHKRNINLVDIVSNFLSRFK